PSLSLQTLQPPPTSTLFPYTTLFRSPLKALAEAHRLPVVSLLTEYQQTLAGILASASDDCVRMLTETGADFGETREKVRVLREADRKSTRLNSSHDQISYAVFCLKKK